MCARVYGSMIDARRGVVIIASAGVILCMHYVMHVHRPRTVDRKPPMSCVNYDSRFRNLYTDCKFVMDVEKQIRLNALHRVPTCIMF